MSIVGSLPRVRRTAGGQAARLSGGVERELLSRAARDAVRQRRIDCIEAGKSRLWRVDLRLSEFANVALLAPSIVLLWWQSWAVWSLAPACVIAVGGMWAFAGWMRPRERRLCRHMVFLARHRRRCAMCRYCIQGLAGPRCPECAFAFDRHDDRYLLIPLINRMYSRQGRQVAAVAIVAVMAAVVLLARGAAWTWIVGWCAGLLAALHVVFAIWVVTARRQQRENERRGEVSFGDRPDPRRPADPRLLRCQYQGLILRWAFLSAVIGGLAVIVSLDPSTLRFASLGGGVGVMYLTLGIPVLGYVAVVSTLMRAAATRLHERQRRLLTGVE